MRATELHQRIHVSLKTLIETAEGAIESDDLLDFTMLESITSKHQERFNQLRNKYSIQQQQNEDVYLAAVLQDTHKVERIIYLISDYVRLRLHKKNLRDGNVSNRKAQQSHLLNS